MELKLLLPLLFLLFVTSGKEIEREETAEIIKPKDKDHSIYLPLAIFDAAKKKIDNDESEGSVLAS